MIACTKIARSVLVGALVGGLTGFHPARAAHAQIGTPVPQAEMPTLAGGSARLLGDAEISVLVFFRPDQENSLKGLKELSACRKKLAGKPVRWTAIASSSVSADSAAATVRESGFAVRVLVDSGDALYGSLGVSLHPVVVIVGRDRKLAAFEPFRSVNFCAVVAARIRHVLREITDAELKSVISPPKAVNGGDVAVAGRNLRLAEALFKGGNYGKALEYVRRSIERDPTLAAAHALLGDILAVRGSCVEAVKAYQKAVEIDPANASAKAGIERCEQAR